MRIFRFSIPISDYYGEGVFFKDLFFCRGTCPTRGEVIAAVKEAAAVDAQYPEDCGEFSEVLEVLRLTEDFPQVYGDLIHTNTRVIHPKWGDQPVSCSVISPLDIYPDYDIK